MSSDKVEQFSAFKITPVNGLKNHAYTMDVANIKVPSERIIRDLPIQNENQQA